MEDNSIKILLIENDRSYNEFFKNILVDEYSSSIFKITNTDNFAQANNLIKKEKFNVIVIDLPGNNETIKNNIEETIKNANKIPVIILTDLYSKELAVESVKMGACDYFVKRHVDENTLPLLLIYAAKQQRFEESIKKGQRNFENIIEHAPDIITIVNKEGKIQFENLSIENSFKYKRNEIVGRNILDFIPYDHRENFSIKLNNAFNNRDTSHLIETKFIHKDGRLRHVEIFARSITDDTGNPVCILSTRDVSERVYMEEELKRLSLIDELTGLHNRRGFLTLLHQQVKCARRNKENLYIMFADLDNLKTVNDTYGHEEGDNVIKNAAQILKSTFRNVDIISRFGGDEFAIVLIQTNPKGVEVVKNRLQERLNVANMVNENPYRLSLSIGITEYNPTSQETIEEIIAKADKLMYEEKILKKQMK